MGGEHVHYVEKEILPIFEGRPGGWRAVEWLLAYRNIVNLGSYRDCGLIRNGCTSILSDCWCYPRTAERVVFLTTRVRW